MNIWTNFSFFFFPSVSFSISHHLPFFSHRVLLLTSLALEATHPGCHSLVTLCLCGLGFTSLYTNCSYPLLSPLPPICLHPHQVRLTEDLASATARLSQLQLEASAHQQRAVELQTKLSSALQDSESRSQRIAGMETQQEGLCWCQFHCFLFFLSGVQHNLGGFKSWSCLV